MACQEAPKDIIAQQVLRLLDMDESRKQQQLAMWSTHAASSNKTNVTSTSKTKSNGGKASQVSASSGRSGGPASTSAASVSTYGGSGGSGSGRDAAYPGSCGSGGSGSGASGSGREPSYSADSPESSGSEGFTANPQATSATNIGAAPGLSLQWHENEPACASDPSVNTKQGGVNSASSQLEHATDMLKAALANWEACLHGEETRSGAQQVKKGHNKQHAQTPDQPTNMPAKIQMNSLMSANPPTQNSAFALKALQKALSDLNGSLTLDNAQAAQSRQGDPQKWELPAAFLEDDAQSMQAVKLLRHHLEKQQEESVEKILKMVREQPSPQQSMAPKPAMDPMANYYPGAPGCNAVWPHPVLGLHQDPTFMIPTAGRFGFPPVAVGPMADTFGMPPMGMVPGLPWAQAMAGNGGQPDARLRRQHQSQGARQQGGTQRAATQSAKAGATGTNAVRKNRAAVPPAGQEEETLRKHLRELQKIEPEKVVLVRKINRLGFESPSVLESHYSKYGTVEKVLVAHSHVKSQNCRFAARLRPSGLGFVVMSKKEEADAILALGPEQVVQSGPNGATAYIRVQRFQRRSEDADDADFPADNEDRDERDTPA